MRGDEGAERRQRRVEARQLLGLHQPEVPRGQGHVGAARLGAQHRDAGAGEARPHQRLVPGRGAGHVGRALARALTPLPVRVRLIDSRAEELAQAGCVPQTLTALPEAEVRRADPGAAFVIVTHDHALDFLIAVEALARADAGYVGMIGSASKRAAFLRHAARAGVDAGPLTCPIAAHAPRDKRPAVIAAFAAAEIMAALMTHVRVPA